jgi:hypothetical protein
MGHASRNGIPRWAKKGLGFILFLALLSPFFGMMADMVGYSEPLENIADHLGAEEETIYKGFLTDYTVPGIDVNIGILISAVVGSLVVLGVAFAWAKVAKA